MRTLWSLLITLYILVKTETSLFPLIWATDCDFPLPASIATFRFASYTHHFGLGPKMSGNRGSWLSALGQEAKHCQR